MTFMHSDPYLVLCDAIAQTVKHNLREPRTKIDPDPLSAWIDWYATSAGLQIRWENVGQSRSGVKTPFVLARRCKAAWEGISYTARRSLT